jgi:threonine dehydratase
VKTLPAGCTVATCSAGNHSQGVALAARLCGSRSVIYMAQIAPVSKVEATRHYGGEVIQVGASFDEAKDACLEAVAAHDDWYFVHPFNDREVIAGTGTIGLEILEQCPEIETIVLSIGGGGLISGVSFVAKSLKPGVRIVGVQLASCPHTYRRFHADRGQEVSPIATKEAIFPLAEEIAVKRVGVRIRRYVDDIVLVTEDEVAVALLAERGKVITEGAAVLARKFAFRPDEHVAVVLSGGNIQLSMLARCIDRALFLRGSRAGLNVVLPYGTGRSPRCSRSSHAITRR